MKLMRGTIQTPAFMPVGTQAAVKTLTPDEVRSTGAEIVLANTYHLMLRPGPELIARLGGVSHFMRWEGPVLSDSGGYQVFSLANRRTLDPDGVTFRSHIDGAEYRLTPQRSVEIQRLLDTDVVMALDVCPGWESGVEEQIAATEMTHQWIGRNISAFRASVTEQSPDRPLLFGICQGGFDEQRRATSARVISDAPVDGLAIGGLSVGEPKDVMSTMLEASVSGLSDDRARYLMGVGSPEDLWNAVAVGIDMFDCVLPTRVARHGGIYTAAGRYNIKAAVNRDLDVSIEEGCDCLACTTFSRAYLHHLFRSKEMLGQRLASIHNLRFLGRQVEAMRTAIVEGRFEAARSAFLNNYEPVDRQRSEEERLRYRRQRAGN